MLPNSVSTACHLWANDGEAGVGGKKSKFIQNDGILGRWHTFPVSRMVRRLYRYTRTSRTKERGKLVMRLKRDLGVPFVPGWLSRTQSSGWFISPLTEKHSPEFQPGCWCPDPEGWLSFFQVSVLSVKQINKVCM